MNQEADATMGQKVKPRPGISKSHTSIFSKYKPPNFTRAISNPTRGFSFLFERGFSFPADVPLEIKPDTPVRDQKPNHIRENTSAKPFNLTCLLCKTKSPLSSSYSPQPVKTRFTKCRLHSCKEKPPGTEDPQVRIVMAPPVCSSWPVKSPSDITCPDSRSTKTSPTYTPKSESPQKSPGSLKMNHSLFGSRNETFTSPERHPIKRSMSPEKRSNSSKYPDQNCSNSGSRRTSPGRHSTWKSTPQKYPDSSKYPDLKSTVFRIKSPDRNPNIAALQKYLSFACKKHPDWCLKSRCNSTRTYPNASKSSDVKHYNTTSRKTSPERCSKCKSVSPDRDSPKLPIQVYPIKSDARQSHLMPRKHIQRSSTRPLPRKVRYKISASKTYVKYNKPKTYKSNESRWPPMSRNIEVLYLTEFNCLVEKFITSLIGKRAKCPILTDRLKSHQMQCPMRPKCDSTTAQTKCTLANTGCCGCCKNRLSSIQDIVRLWLNKIPLETCGDTPQESTERRIAVQELINSIVAVEKSNVGDICYKRSVDIAADRYFNRIRISYPGPKEDKTTLKNGLKKYLILKLLKNRKKCPQQGQTISFDLFANNVQESSCLCNKIEPKDSGLFRIINDKVEPSVNFMKKSVICGVRTHRSTQRTRCNRKPNPTKSQDSTSRAKCKRNRISLNLNSDARCGDVSPNSIDSFFDLTCIEECEPCNPKCKDVCGATDNKCLGDSSIDNDCNECLTSPMVSGDASPRIEKNKPKHFENQRSYLDIEKEIDDWLKKCTFFEQNAGTVGCFDKSKVIDALLKDLKPYFNQPYEVLNKSFWKRKIITIMKSFYAGTGDPIDYKPIITRFADDLANRCVRILSRLQCIEGPYWNCDVSYNCYHRLIKNSEKFTIGSNAVSKEVLRLALLSNIDEYLQNKHFAYSKQIKETILDLLMDNIGLIQNDLDFDIKNNIINILKETNALSDFEIENLVNNILQSCKVLTTVLRVVTKRTELNGVVVTRPCTSISVLTSLNDMTPSFDAVSSTPKKKSRKQQHLSQLNPEQQAYTEKIKTIIKSWIDSSPPNFKYRKGSENMTEVMVEDLSGEICDHFRLEQIIDRYSDKNQVITIYIYKWLLKYDIVEDIKYAETYTQELVSSIQKITVPNMSRPQHGNRQDIEMIKQAANTHWVEPYYPRVQDILEDQISVFMNEYPSEIFVNTDKNARGKTVHELAEKIQPKLDKADSNKEVEQEVYRWMNIMVLPRLRDRVDEMAHSLFERLKRIPHDETIAKYGEHTKQQRIHKQLEKYEKKEKQKVVEQGTTTPSTQKHNESHDNNDKTMTHFVAEYIEHCHAEEDPLTKEMYTQILKTELRRLNPNTLKDVYENKKYEQFNAGKLNKELIYIKEVSDWVKTIPMDSFYNTVENADRAEFVMGVAKNIMEIEEERHNAPDAMDYDVYLGHNVAELFGTLPILPTHKDTVHLAVVDLLQRLAVIRGDYNIEPTPPGEGILNFIEEFMKRHGPDFADDKLKLEAWSARLLKELKKLLIEGQVQDKEGFEQRLLLIPKPGDESVRHFNLELDYAREIVDWLKNLELRKSFDESNVEELAYKMADYKIKFPDDRNKTKDIIIDWVKRLPLNENENTNISILTMQLANRIEKVTEKEDLNATHPADLSIKLNTSNMRNKSMQKQQCRNCCPIDNPGELIVRTIETWNDKFHLEGNENEVKNFKEFVKAKLYQKIAELSDAHLYKSNKVLFAHCLAEELDNLLNTLPPTLRIKGDKEDLIQELIDNVLQTCEFISEISAAETYRIELENAIQSLLPKPGIIENNYDLELLKDHIVDKFILDNFDHASNTRIKNIIKKDIDRYAQVAQKLCAVPIDNEKCIEGVYGSLYTVEIPNLEALKENIELIKTKCEIKEWFETLPIQSVDSVGQLYRNKKIMDLARILRSYELDNTSPKSMSDVIRSFLQKELQQPGMEDNINKCTNDLLSKLERTKHNRKFYEPSEKSSKRNDKKEPFIANSIVITKQNEQEIKKPADIVIEIVEKWCESVLSTTNLSAEESEKIKNILESKIIIKVCELNSSPTTLYSDLLYAYLLEEKVKRILMSFRIPSNDELISQLISAVESARPLFIEDKSRYAYKKELENAVNGVVEMPEDPTPEDKKIHDEIRDNIISYYLEYKCNKDNEKGKQHYMDKIVDVLTNYNYEIIDDDINDIRADCLVEVNRLLHELNQITEPGEIAMNEEIAENRMKQEVSNFLKEQKNFIKNKRKQNQVRDNLSRELTEIEKNGHNPKKYEKIKTAVNRNMKKLSASIPSGRVEAFVDKLKSNEEARKQLRFRKSDPRSLSLPTDFSESNRQQKKLTHKSLPMPFEDCSSTGYPQSPIAMPKMVPFPPIVLPENSNASWNAYNYGQDTYQPRSFSQYSGIPSQPGQASGAYMQPPQDSYIPHIINDNRSYSGKSAFSNPCCMMPPGQAAGADIQPPHDRTIPPLPQFNRYPPLNLQTDTISTWNSSQPSTEPAPHNIPANSPHTQPPQDSTLPPLPQFNRYPPLNLQTDTISTWNSTQPSADLASQNNPASIPITQLSPVKGFTVQGPPTQVSPISGNTVTAWKSSDSGAQFELQDVSANVHMPPTETSPVHNLYSSLRNDGKSSSGKGFFSNPCCMMPPGQAAGANMQPPQDSTIPPLPQFNRYPPLNLQTDTISTWNSTQPSTEPAPQNIPASSPHTQHPQDSSIPQFNRYPPLNLQTDTISTWNSTQPSTEPAPQNIPASSPHMQPPQDSSIPPLPQFNGYPPLNLQTDTISTWNSTQPSTEPAPQNIPTSSALAQSSPAKGSFVQGRPTQVVPRKGSPEQGRPSQVVPRKGSTEQNRLSHVVPRKGSTEQDRLSHVVPRKGSTEQGRPSQVVPRKGLFVPGRSTQIVPSKSSAVQGRSTQVVPPKSSAVQGRSTQVVPPKGSSVQGRSTQVVTPKSSAVQGRSIQVIPPKGSVQSRPSQVLRPKSSLSHTGTKKDSTGSFNQMVGTRLTDQINLDSPNSKPEPRSKTEIRDQGPKSVSMNEYTQPPTRSLGVTTKPPTSEFGAQKSLGTLPFMPCPYMPIPMPTCLQNLGNIERLSNISMPRQVQDINCDCEHCMEGFPLELLAGWDSGSPCYPPVNLWMPPHLGMPSFNLI